MMHTYTAGFLGGIDVGNRAILLLGIKSSRPNFHTPRRQTSANSAWAQPAMEENGRQNFEDSSSRGVPKQTTPVPVHVYRILFAFPLAP